MEKLTIVGLVRSAEKTIEKEIQILTNAFCKNFEISYFLVESDSNDGTLEKLSNLEAEYGSFKFVSLGKLESVIPNRIERLSHCRNFYLNYLKNSELHFQSSYFVVADLDGVNMDLTSQAVIDTFKIHHWDVCTANQKFRYYDVYALRSEGWITQNCEVELSDYLDAGMNPYRAFYKAVLERQIHIPQDSPWIKTDSSFGGLGIYSAKAFFSSTYSHLDELGRTVCEHVPYHVGLSSQGFDIYINPNLINCVSSPHTIHHKLRNRLHRYFLSIAYDIFGQKLFNMLRPSIHK
jgi:hypothetical protein